MELGLLYYNARFYVPGIGRFASADTIVPDPANPQSYNRYSYVENRPLIFSDPTGHQPAACSYVGECGIPIGLIDFDGVKSNGQILLDLITFSVIDPVMSVVELGEASFSGQMRQDFQTNPLGAALHYGPTTLEVVGTLMGVGVATKGLIDDGIRAFGGDTTRLAGELVPGLPCSFSAATLVTTAEGMIPISEVSLETLVLAFDETTGEIGYYPVTAVWSHQDPVLVFLTIDGERVVTTPEHPFFTTQGAWVAAGNLQPGDEIRTAVWGTGTVQAITFTATPQTMYNFTVATAHTYFVGQGQWLVHNDCLPAVSSGRLQPQPNATGPHTTFRRDGTTGEINHYATWAPNPRHPTGFDLELRVDIIGPPHFNKATGTYVSTPHVHSNSIPGGVGPASQWQIPLRH